MLEELLNIRRNWTVKLDKILKSPIVLALVVFLCVLLLVPSVVFAQDNITRESINPGSGTDSSQISAFVTRFYQLCLSRDPDSGGLNGWVNYLINGTLTGADVAYSFIFSQEFIDRDVSNEDYVTIMYRAFFGREPDSDGYNGWLTWLNSGRTRKWVLAGFVNSQEFKNLCNSYGVNPGSINLTDPADKHPLVAEFVTRFYRQYLSREPDLDGLNGWVDYLITGQLSGAEVAYNFVSSQEFIDRGVSNEDYVTIMYRALFDREPDANGYTTWLSWLNNGLSKLWILSGFASSQEFKELCVRYGISPGYINVSNEEGINPSSRGEKVTEKTSFIGYCNVTIDELVNMFKKYNPNKVDKARRIAEYYVKYGKIFNIRADLAWSQMCHETGFLKYTGFAKEEWNNFCGLGVIGEPDVGCRFKTEELGIIAHYAHLAWYVYPDHVNQYCNRTYDPKHFGDKHNYNGNSSIETLNGRWAVPGTYYAAAIAKYANQI